MCFPGACECKHDTAGLSCERCKDGYYGDSTKGTDEDCEACPCPSGATCAVVPRTTEVVCTNCPPGTTGRLGHRGPGGGAWIWGWSLKGLQLKGSGPQGRELLKGLNFKGSGTFKGLDVRVWISGSRVTAVEIPLD